MKKIFILCFTTLLSFEAMAQNEGRSFVSGSVGLDFNNRNYAESPTFRNYSYSVYGRFGKFKTNTRAEGLVINSNMQAQTNRVSLLDDQGRITNIVLDDLGRLSIGAGHFWEFYKHFGDKAGMYGGPSISGSYDLAKSFTVGSDSKTLTTQSERGVTVGLSLNAGFYYKLTNKWWLDMSFGYANPFSITYKTIIYNQRFVADGKSTGRNIEYSFAPNLSLPNVGVGLRYMIK